MLLIVAHHFSVHGGFEFAADTITLNRLWIQFIQIGGKIGVNVFVLISGYFLVTAPGNKTDKLLKLWLQIFTYSAVIFIVFAAAGATSPSARDIIKAALPITFSQWSFASAYFVLYLLSPFVNKLLNALGKRDYRLLLCILTVCWCIVPTFTAKLFESNYLLWFIYLYSLAGYLRIHADTEKLSARLCLLCALCITMPTFLSTVVFDQLGKKIAFFASHATFFTVRKSCPCCSLPWRPCSDFCGLISAAKKSSTSFPLPPSAFT